MNSKIIGKWSLPYGFGMTLHENSEYSEGWQIERSMEVKVLVAELKCVASLVLSKHSHVERRKRSTSAPLASRLPLPHNGLCALKSPKIKYGAGS